MRYLTPKTPKVIVEDKGSSLMELMLLDQYTNSTLLKQYFRAYTEEMDFLFAQISEVYFGRMLEYAIGKQLDVIGEILQQKRSVFLPNVYFGFQGATDVDGIASLALPNAGGTFRSIYQGDIVAAPLSDTIYRRVLQVIGMCTSSETVDLEFVYQVVIVLMGKHLSLMQLSDAGHRIVNLTLYRKDVTDADIQLLFYMTKYFIPNGVSFTITQL
jgi:hypothetical protein